MTLPGLTRPPRDPIVAPRVELDTDTDIVLSGAATDAFVTALGGRAAMVEILQLATGDPLVDRVVALLDDPVYADRSLPQLCASAGLHLGDFFKVYQRAMQARGEIVAVRVITERMVAVVDDVMRRSAPYDEACACTRAIPPTTATCATCGGTGIRRVYPELDRQKVALDLAKLLSKGGPLIQQNVLAAPGGTAVVSHGSLADLSAAVSAVLKPRRPLPPAEEAPT